MKLSKFKVKHLFMPKTVVVIVSALMVVGQLYQLIGENS